jgi:hypothetical protein
MRTILALALLSSTLAVGCAHSEKTTLVYDGSAQQGIVGERRGDQLWFNNGYISSISEDGHVRLPDFSDAYLVDNQLYLSPPDQFLASRPIGARVPPSTGAWDRSR